MVIATADQIRDRMNKAFVERARREGQTNVTIMAGGIHASLKLDNRLPAVCSAIDAKKFQDQFRVNLSLRSGPKQVRRSRGVSSLR